MATTYSEKNILKYLQDFLNNNLTTKDFQIFLENLLDIENFNDNKNNLLLIILFNSFEDIKNNYSPWVILLVENLKNKIILNSLKNIIDTDNSINTNNIKDIDSNNFVFNDVTAQINPNSSDQDEMYEVFKERYKRILPSEFPNVKFPAPGTTDFLSLTDNMTIPGAIYSMDLELDSEGNVISLTNLTKKVNAKDAQDIFQGLMGELMEN